MSRRPTPWQEGPRARTSRGLFTKLIRASLVLGVLSLLFGAEPVAADTAITYSVSGIVGTNGWFRGSAGGNYVVVHWTVNIPTDQIESSSGCEVGGVRVDGPTMGTTKTCTVTLIGGAQPPPTPSPLKIDNPPPPRLSPGAGPPPAPNAWYNHSAPVTP